MATDSNTLAPRVVSMDAAAAALDLHRTTLYDLIHRGELRTIKLGGRRVVPVAELDALIARKLSEVDGVAAHAR